MKAPGSPYDDSFIKLFQGDDDLYRLGEPFMVADDPSYDNTSVDKANINYFPKELRRLRNSGDAGFLDLILTEGMQPMGGSDMTPRARAQRCREQARTLRQRVQVDEDLENDDPKTESTDEAGNEKGDAPSQLAMEFERMAQAWQEIADGKLSVELANLIVNRDVASIEWLQLAHHVSNLDLTWVERRIGCDLRWLLDLLQKGNLEAGDLIIDIITVMIEQINHLEDRHPQAFTDLIRWKIRWPGLLCKHPFYQLHSKPPKGLAHGYPFEIHESKKWDPQSAVTQTAMHLLIYLYRLQQTVKDCMRCCRRRETGGKAPV